MKIVLAIPYNPLEEIGGLEIGTVRLARSLERIGHTTKIIAIGKSGSDEGINIDGKQNMAEICEWLIRNHKDFDILSWMEIFPGSGEINMQCLVSGLLRSFGKKVFLMVATSGNLRNRGGVGFTRTLIQNTMDGYVISNSGQVSEFENYGIKNNIYPIGFGVDTENTFYPAEASEKMELRKKLNLPLNKLIVLFIGRFVEMKRPIFLLEACRSLSEIYRNSVLVIVGSGMGQHDSIEEQAIEMSKKCKNIILREFSHDLKSADYFRASDIFVLPSDREGQPNVMLEAMASGIPVIGSAIPGITELLKNDENGLTFSVNDSKEFANLIKKLAKDEKARKEFGIAGRELICREKSLDYVARQYQALYEK